MIILDTNIISELMREKPDEIVKVWADQLMIGIVGTTTITLAEIYSGLYQLPEGKRKEGYFNKFDAFIKELFAENIFRFDEQTALIYGMLSAESKSQGHNVGSVDIMIAGIAKQYGAKLATRNVKDFQHCDIDIVNPFDGCKTVN